MTTQGYYRYPTLHKDTVVFVSEDDLWEVPAEGGQARRLTFGKGKASHPCFSPDGKWLAFSATEEGHAEVYVMPACGGPLIRLTYAGDMSIVVGWLDAKTVLFASPTKQPFSRVNDIFKVSIEGGLHEKMPLGLCNFIDYNRKGKGCVIQRHGSREFAYWKRYKGGTAGQIWIDPKGKGDFEKLIDRVANFARPLWIHDRIYFTADHEGMGNLYSCKPDGGDERLEVAIPQFYIRNQTTDGKAIVFHAGGDLYYFDPKKKAHHKIQITYNSAFSQRNRKFVAVQKYMHDFSIHPEGHHLSLTARGRAFSFSNFEGPVSQYGAENLGRYRLSKWLHDGERIVVVNDTDGEEKLEVFDADTQACLRKMKKPEIGRVVEMMTSPVGDEVVLTNHKNELVHVQLKNWKVTVLDRNAHEMIKGMDWSPDGKWVAYGCSLSVHTSVIKLVNLKTGKMTQLTKPVLQDSSPSFDPDGKYLYFISHRQFDPVWDSLHFEMGFPLGARPYLIPLQKDLLNPFTDQPHDLAREEQKEAEKTDKKSKSSKNSEKDIKIDLVGIEDRVIPFPLPDGNYSSIYGLKGKVLYTNHSVMGSMDDEGGGEQGVTLYVYDFESQKSQSLVGHVKDYDVSKDYNWLVYEDTDSDLRVIKAGEKPEEGDDLADRKKGWINMARVKVPVKPYEEWQQIYKEAWRLQRDHFWVEDMSKVDWLRVYDRYWPLVMRLGSREELNDLMWEMQGELGTSHAYVVGGDLKPNPKYTVGMLGADFDYDKGKQAYRITHIVKGDVWKSGCGSPLAHPGINVKPGDLLHEVAGTALSETVTPHAALLNMAGQEIRLKVSDKTGKKTRFVTVKTLRSEEKARYREWVENNRAYVHAKTKGKIGYVHIPDMSVWGFSEFHRSFLAECDRQGLVVDVRFNGGGSVSPLLLEKLSRKQLGYDLSRWMGSIPYPYDSLPGPLVAIANEYAGSDGDMFSHGFKMLKLGKLVGKRTWGGVVGINVRYSLVDKGYTTQPEYSFWFKDIGWKLENYGAEPDVDVEIYPKDYVTGTDPQLDKALEIVLNSLKTNPVEKPDFGKKPNLKLPA